MPFMIEHQTQPCPVSCVATSLAMLAGKPGILDKLNKLYREEDKSVGQLLTTLGIAYTSFDTANDRVSFIDDGIYLCSVPSLNIQGGMHQLVVELVGGEWIVFDPNLGRDDRLYYSAKPNDADFPKSVMLGSGYAVDAFISHEVLAYWRVDNQWETI